MVDHLAKLLHSRGDIQEQRQGRVRDGFWELRSAAAGAGRGGLRLQGLAAPKLLHRCAQAGGARAPVQRCPSSFAVGDRAPVQRCPSSFAVGARAPVQAARREVAAAWSLDAGGVESGRGGVEVGGGGQRPSSCPSGTQGGGGGVESGRGGVESVHRTRV
jgi:hypothetical protein